MDKEINLIEAIIFGSVAIASLIFSIFIIRNPLRVFEIQKKFYALINWRIEPISVEKEIRNTRLMGAFLILFVVAACIYFLMHA